LVKPKAKGKEGLNGFAKSPLSVPAREAIEGERNSEQRDRTE
jgi:hypothetical protein